MHGVVWLGCLFDLGVGVLSLLGPQRVLESTPLLVKSLELLQIFRLALQLLQPI